ncbi:ABC transporter ATP-binding protein [Devosia nitrariae]|uniref:ABC transporter ATP-binding protein n=1 Tax=Devosia nitrariae TaxID=2071872 RepID=A0ABQ5WD03_9HYPH|nr:ABC transporter ATP-binding protein [Devosia nitrariae]GLQ58010.1 ABC transporter ATP-binding protein [Devosia nitrariae]
MQHTLDQPLLEIDHLTRVFLSRQGLSVTRLEAVDDASLTLTAGKPEIYALAGESGSGKTTLARMVLGLERPSEGTLNYKGRSVGELSARDKRTWFYKEVQPVFQDPFATFSPMKRIDSYLYETARNYQVAKGADVDKRIDEALRVVGLTLAEVRGRYPNELSGGQAQRVSIARALITRPSLLVADEPVSMLDASLRMSILNLFKDLRDKEGVAVLYITHDLATAYYTADRIGVMLRGWIVETGPVERVLGSPLHPYTQLLKSSVPQADPDKAWSAEPTLAPRPVTFPVSGGCKFAARCPKVMDRCRVEIPASYEAEGRSVKCFLYA